MNDTNIDLCYQKKIFNTCCCFKSDMLFFALTGVINVATDIDVIYLNISVDA